MRVSIDPDSPVPPFEQLRSQVAALVRAGALPTGTRLPSIRQLAADLGIAPGTVARAYAELEQAGLVATTGARGTRVAAQDPPPSAVASAADDFIARARAEGLDLAAMLALVRVRHG